MSPTSTADRSCPIVAMSGPPRRRGEIHGEELRDRIQAGVARWHDSLGQETGEDPTSYLADFLEHTDFLPAIEQWTPDLLEEIEGIARGADLDFDTMFAYNLMDEEWLHQQRRRGLPPGDGDAEPHHCSAIAVRPGAGHPTLVAQNMDLPLHFDGSQCVLHIRHQGGQPDVAVLSAAGLIATTGLNSAGVGVCVNALFQLDSEPQGLPVAFAIRGALAHRSGQEAADFITSIDHASGQNFVIGDPKGVIDLECSARGVVRYEPTGDVITHTNHPLVSEHVSQHLARVAASDGGESAMLNSKQRLGLLDGILAEDPSVKGIVAALRDETVPVCRVAKPDGGALTFGTVVLQLTNAPVLNVCPGPPTEEAFRAIDLL